MKSLKTSIFAAACLLAIPAQATTVSGIEIADNIKPAQDTLVLNGAGVRSKFLSIFMLAAYTCRSQVSSLTIFWHSPVSQCGSISPQV